ncbi:MAG: DegT/DnrJ/EryC1/StrS family aminotransferase [Gemmatales bacterium]|nr:DegT/DnrJ/EryC1/StrS family aminotransferase [Gemmatales bacterium]
MSALALFGGPKAVQSDPGDIFRWPVISPEAEDAVLEVLRAGKMSGVDITKEFEREYAAWQGVRYALAHNNGTAALHAAMFGVGIGKGDEVICPSITYWASCLSVFSLGGTVVFADIDPVTLNIDPDNIERHITERTKAILVVHYQGYPADMDRIMAIARRYRLAVIEDGSHAHGALYKGRMVGSIGDVSAFSLMSGKSLACGEGGILLTNDRCIYERAMIFGHYERSEEITLPELVEGVGLPWGGCKYRMHQLTSAVGRVQLRNYPAQMMEIDSAMNYFWDLLEGVPGIRPHRPPKDSGLTMGGWYMPSGLYHPEELSGLSLYRFCHAVTAEGSVCRPGCNKALHLHPLLNTIDVYDDGRPTRLACLPTGVDVRQPIGSLPVAEGIQERVFGVPWFKRVYSQIIEEHAAAFRKVVENHRDLLVDDPGNPPHLGSWGLSLRGT